MTALPDGPLVEPAVDGDESPAEVAAADRRYWDDRLVDEPGFETDGQQYKPGDRVRFPAAGQRSNRARIYEITAEADGCHYQISRGDVRVIGIEHVEEK